MVATYEEVFNQGKLEVLDEIVAKNHVEHDRSPDRRMASRAGDGGSSSAFEDRIAEPDQRLLWL
jgi:hypothetical protein